jgi:hypothetical protein
VQGLLAFYDAGTAIHSCGLHVPTGSGPSYTVSCTLRYATVGKHSVVATFGVDPNFAGSSSSPAQNVTVTTAGLPSVSATMQWTFFHTPAYTRILSLTLAGSPVGGVVIVTCKGKGCPYKKRAVGVRRVKPCKAHSKHCTRRRTGSFDLTPPFRHRRLRVGAKVTISVIKPGWIGKNYVFTMRARRGPRIQIACLAPGSAKPGFGC